MTQKQFNDKYRQFIPQGWGGLEFDMPKVTEHVDLIMQDMVRIPGFELHQIKLKFGKARFYFDTKLFNKWLEHAIMLKVEEKINDLVRGYDNFNTAKLRVEANSPYNDGWTREHHEKELNERMDIIGQNGNEGTHYEEDWMDKQYRDDYHRAVSTGMFFEWYPNLTGQWQKDKYAFVHEIEQIKAKIKSDDKETK